MDKFKDLKPEEVLAKAKITDLTGKELTPAEVQELAKMHEEQRLKNIQFYEEHKNDEKFQKLFPRRQR